MISVLKEIKSLREMAKKRVIILGGGFGGVYTAMHLEKQLRKRDELEIVLVNRENYFVYQPMLSEVVGGTLGALDTVSPLRRLLKKTKLYLRTIESIDTEKKQILLSPQFSHTPLCLDYDYLVLALGNMTDFRDATGLHEHALPFKTLSDAVAIRNHLIEIIETAATENDPVLKKELLTFIVGGGGFSGCELVAELNDLVRRLSERYETISKEEIRVLLVHSKDRLFERELSKPLSLYAEKILKKRGVEIRFNERLIRATPGSAVLASGEELFAKTVISTVPSSPNPLLKTLPSPIEIKHGKVVTDACLQVQGSDCLFALGDCALIPNKNQEGDYCPPTAQFAVRQAKLVAKNILATVRGTKKEEFRFKALGMMGALGHHCAVGQLFGRINISGFLGWLIWRAVYLIKLPGFDRKIKVALSWLLETIIPLETVQFKLTQKESICELYHEKGGVLFNQGDSGDNLYVIKEGSVGIYKNGIKIALLKKGELVGEMALINRAPRNATVICEEPTRLVAIPKKEFELLAENLDLLRSQVTKTAEERGLKPGN